VRKLSLVCPTSPSFDWRSFALEILAFPTFAALEDLLIETGPTNNQPLLHAPVLLPLKSLTIDSPYDTLSFETIEPLLPADVTLTKSLTLNEVRFTSIEMQNLLERLGSTIASLSLGARPNRSTIFARPYRSDLDLPHIPTLPFTRFPNLVSLALPHTQGPSLRLLKTLASSCRHLVELDFFGSVWTSDASLPPDLTAQEHFDLVFHQQAILSALESLQKLKKVTLGCLMYSDDTQKYAEIEDVLEGRGIEVDWNPVDADADDAISDEYHYEDDDGFRGFRFNCTQGGPRLSF